MSNDRNESVPPAPEGRSGDAWERELIARVAMAAVVEQRRARRWNVAFKFALLAYLVVLLVLYLPRDWTVSAGVDRHTALVEVSGIIQAEGDASADRIITGLRAAFEDEATAGVVVRINSPGGSPVQAGYIYDEIRRLRAAHPAVPVYAVITDVAASGGYYVAAAADRIYADRASIVGSIGVLMNGFGFVDAMDKLGVERRLLTSGEHKGLLDPFSPVREAERAHIAGLLEAIHRQFIDAVRTGRGDRLADTPDLFSGLIWTGDRGVELGLVDGLASSSEVAREVIEAEEIVDFTPAKGLLDSLAERVGAIVAERLVPRATERWELR